MKLSREEYMQMYEIIGHCMEVHKELGRGMEEPIYQEALERELNLCDVPYEREKVLRTYYKGQLMDKVYQADFYIHGVMVELKSVSQIHSEHRAQLFNYMRITKVRRGILINFGERSMRAERYVYTEENDDFTLLTQDNLRTYVDIK